MPDAAIRMYSVVIQFFAFRVCRLENKKPYQNGRVGFPEWKGSFDRKNRYAEINVRGFTGFAVVGSPFRVSVYTRFSGLCAWAVWRFGRSMPRSAESVHRSSRATRIGYPEPCVLVVSDTDSPEYRVSGKGVVPMIPGGYYSESFRTKVTPRSASSE